MTRFRIYATAKPTLSSAPVIPMSREDRLFWEHRERASREREERLRGKAQ